MNIECEYCGALRWKREKLGLCCINSEVILAPLQLPLPEIYYFLTEKEQVLFVNKIRVYNQGDHYHQISLALPEQREIPKFFQIYFYDSSDIEVQIDRRYKVMKQSLNRDMIINIQNVLIDLNPFVNTYISARNKDLKDSLYYILIYNKHSKDMRQYNTPLAKEVAAICFFNENMHVRDILIVRHNDELKKISELH
ncbi:22204_t:CDS:2, partial [Dentiscutata erythropus]